MPDPMPSPTTDALRFFGRMSATISHDLKNTLSIMNESAGLLEDLALLAQKGRPLDPQRIQQLCGTMKRQIQRNDAIVRNMNRFAHAVDDPVKEIGLADSLELLLAICRRLTDAKGMTLAVEPCRPDVTVVTRPFDLFHLLWLLLEWGMRYAGPSRRMVWRIEPGPATVRLVCQGLEGLCEDAARGFPAAPWGPLLAPLEARTEIGADRRSISVIVPRKNQGAWPERR